MGPELLGGAVANRRGAQSSKPVTAPSAAIIRVLFAGVVGAAPHRTLDPFVHLAVVAAPPHAGLTMIAGAAGSLDPAYFHPHSASVASWSAVTSHSNASAVVARWASFGGGGTR